MENSIEFIQIGLNIAKVIIENLFTLFTICIVAAVFYMKKGGFGGIFFSGKNRNKIYEYAYENNNCAKKIFVYKLLGKSGYEGYGVEFTQSKSSGGIGGFRMQASGSFIEFTKNEAEMIVELVSSNIEKSIPIGA